MGPCGRRSRHDRREGCRDCVSTAWNSNATPARSGRSRLLRRAKRQAELKGVHLKGSEHRRARSDLEEDFFALVHLHHLPTPETNVKLGRWEVDFLWREQRLVVETDSFLYRRGSISFEDDHARDLDLRQQGFTLLRFTDKQLEDEPERVAADVIRALAQ